MTVVVSEDAHATQGYAICAARKAFSIASSAHLDREVFLTQADRERSRPPPTGSARSRIGSGQALPAGSSLQYGRRGQPHDRDGTCRRTRQFHGRTVRGFATTRGVLKHRAGQAGTPQLGERLRRCRRRHIGEPVILLAEHGRGHREAVGQARDRGAEALDYQPPDYSRAGVRDSPKGHPSWEDPCKHRRRTGRDD
jgi:hypothetical protein